MIIVALSYGVVVFLSAYIAQGPMRQLVAEMPGWLSHGFEIAGGILPAVGFGLLMKIMLKAKFFPYLLIGFLAASFIHFGNLLPVAILGTAAALYQFFNDKEKAKLVQLIEDKTSNMGGGYEDGNSKKNNNQHLLSKKDITKLGLRSVLLQASFNYERMQAGGWLYSMLPFLKRIYKDDKQGLADCMTDHLDFINTSPPFVAFLMGLILSLEENKEDRSTIKGLRVALFGPLAGIGDAIYWFTILPIVAGITASFCKDGNLLGPIIFFLVYLGIFIMRIFWAHMGYDVGTRAITLIKDNSEIISKAATILGMTVIGGLIATYVHIDVVAKVAISKGHFIALQSDFFDRIFPNILPFGYTFLLYYFLKKKNTSPVLLILVTFILSILLSFMGIL